MEALVTQTKREVINFGESWKTSEREEKAGDSKCAISRGTGLSPKTPLFEPLQIVCLLLILKAQSTLSTSLTTKKVSLASPTGFEPVLPP